MKKEIFIEVAAYSLFMLFVYASLNKLVGYDFYIYDLRRSPLLQAYATPLSVLVPASELIISALLIVPKTRTQGFFGATVLMTLFTIYVTGIVFSVDERPCSCGGIIRTLTWKQHLVFNTVFLFLALTGLTFSKRQRKNNYA